MLGHALGFYVACSISPYPDWSCRNAQPCAACNSGDVHQHPGPLAACNELLLVEVAAEAIVLQRKGSPGSYAMRIESEIRGWNAVGLQTPWLLQQHPSAAVMHLMTSFQLCSSQQSV